MAEENKTVSAAAGSTEAASNVAADPNLSGGTGQSANKEPQAKANEEMVPKSQYTELEQKLGEQGRQLGEARDFVEGIAPLLGKLENNQELVDAILKDKISPEVLAAAIKGEVSPKEAQTVSEAHEEIKKDLGKKGYEQATPQQIEKLVSDKVADLIGKSEQKIGKQLLEAEQLRDFEDKVSSFIARTPDFPAYAVAIEAYIESHPGLDDMETAYHAVKGFALGKKAEEDKQAAAGEAAKDVAANAAGGGVQSTKVINDQAIVDQLIGQPKNPNVF